MTDLIDIATSMHLSGPHIRRNPDTETKRNYHRTNPSYKSIRSYREDCDCSSGGDCSECGGGDCSDCDCTSDNCDDC